MERRSIVVVLGLVVDPGGRLLITQRHDPAFADAHLKWDLPGGKNEFGESTEATARREVQEETGLAVEVISLIPQVVNTTWKNDAGEQHTLVMCYICQVSGGELRTTDPKIREARWITLSELGNYDFLYTTKKFLEYYKRGVGT